MEKTSIAVNVLIDKLGTKLDIGTSQSRALVAMSTIFLNAIQQWLHFHTPLDPHIEKKGTTSKEIQN